MNLQEGTLTFLKKRINSTVMAASRQVQSTAVSCVFSAALPEIAFQTKQSVQNDLEINSNYIGKISVS